MINVKCYHCNCYCYSVVKAHSLRKKNKSMLVLLNENFVGFYYITVSQQLKI